VVRAQVGNEVGVQAVGRAGGSGGASFPGLLADITADGANTFTISAAAARTLRPGMKIDLVAKTTGVVLAAGRNITGVDTTTGVVTYSGADVATVAGTTGVYTPGSWKAALSTGATNLNNRDEYTNLNGGGAPQYAFDQLSFGSVQAMRDRLQTISATTYSDAELDKMTYNDLIYAIRVNDASGSIK
jgi:autotransporter translocation and assembly factor TamB